MMGFSSEKLLRPLSDECSRLLTVLFFFFFFFYFMASNDNCYNNSVEWESRYSELQLKLL